MAVFRGFISSLQVREDGWIEVVIQAVHAGNAKQTLFVHDIDGDPNSANRRLAHLSLLRDAVARVLPVEVEYGGGEEGQGNIIQDLTICPRPSFDGRSGGRRIEGVVIGLGVAELDPSSGTSPYRDPADLASVTVLEDDGSIEALLLDLQRPDNMTAQSMLALIRKGFRTRRPIAFVISEEGENKKFAAANRTAAGTGFILACEWKQVEKENLDYTYAYVERIGQRYESFETDEATALSRVRVVYTTAPGQTPEGDISDNGAFTPQRLEAWVHGDSPLLTRLEAALRDELQVKLGLWETAIHEVEIVAGLGSIAKPVWIRVNRCVLPSDFESCLCENVPTVQTPTGADLDELQIKAAWRAQAYFSEGIWRFVIFSGNQSKLTIDGKDPCCDEPFECSDSVDRIAVESTLRTARGKTIQCHAYLKGLHDVELLLTGRRCAEPFQLKAYRIR